MLYTIQSLGFTDIEHHSHTKKGVTALLSIPYQDSDSDSNTYLVVKYTPYSPKVRAVDATIISDEDILRTFAMQQFPSEGSFTPGVMEIRERSDKSSNEDMRRIVLLANDGLHYKVFQIPSFTEFGTGQNDGDVAMS